MNYHLLIPVLAACLAFIGGCGPSPFPSDATGDTKAVIVGRVATSAESAGLFSAQNNGVCPDLLVSVNGSPVTSEFDDDCSFLIREIEPAEFVDVRVEVVELGVAGTVELSDVLDGELIEILVETDDDSLTISVQRRTTPEPWDGLPEIIYPNDVSVRLEAGLFDQGLEVRGNNFTLVGEAGDDCDDSEEWTIIGGDVLVLGNNATFRNIKFAGFVELRGNNTRFINCCLGDGLMIFGNGAAFGEDGRWDDDDWDDHDWDDDDWGDDDWDDDDWDDDD